MLQSRCHPNGSWFDQYVVLLALFTKGTIWQYHTKAMHVHNTNSNTMMIDSSKDARRAVEMYAVETQNLASLRHAK